MASLHQLPDPVTSQTTLEIFLRVRIQFPLHDGNSGSSKVFVGKMVVLDSPPGSLGIGSRSPWNPEDASPNQWPPGKQATKGIPNASDVLAESPGTTGLPN